MTLTFGMMYVGSIHFTVTGQILDQVCFVEVKLFSNKEYFRFFPNYRSCTPMESQNKYNSTFFISPKIFVDVDITLTFNKNG